MIDTAVRTPNSPDVDEDGREVPLSTSITGSIMCLSHVMERYANARLPSFGLSPSLTLPRVRLLLAVANGVDEGISTRMSDIAYDLGVTARTITTMVDALERDGLLERMLDPDDRRAISLVLTDEGQAIIPRLMSALHEIGASVMSPLAESEQESLNELLVRLIERETG